VRRSSSGRLVATPDTFSLNIRLTSASLSSALSLGDPWADSTSPHGRLMLTVLGGIAEFERDLILRRHEGRARAILITPHISSASARTVMAPSINLRTYLQGGPLRNVVDWDGGY
jgi:hypothetical protein